MNDFCDNDDYNEEVTEEEQEEATSAAEAIIAAEFDSQYARIAWETMLETQEEDGFLHLT